MKHRDERLEHGNFSREHTLYNGLVKVFFIVKILSDESKTIGEQAHLLKFTPYIIDKH